MAVSAALAPAKVDGWRRDFLWTDKEELHKARRKAILKAHPEVKSLQGRELWTVPLVLFVSCTQIYLAYSLRKTPIISPLFLLTAYAIGGTFNQNTFLSIHDITHNLVFKSGKANRLLAIWANLPIGLPFAMMFKRYHDEHHRFFGEDGLDTDLPTALELKLLNSTPGKLFFLTFQIFFYALRPTIVRQIPFTGWIMFNIVAQITFDCVVVNIWGWNALVYFLLSSFFAGSLHPLAGHFIAEHYLFDGYDQETWSYYGPLNVLIYNTGYHNVHGYIDSFPVPMHLPSASAPAKSAKGKGKAQDPGAGKATPYDVVASWTAHERDDVERKVAMASLLGFSTVLLKLSIPPHTNPASLVFPTPLFPQIDPRTAKAGTEGLVLQLWRIEIVDYTDETIKSTSLKGNYGLSNSTAPLFPPSTTLLSLPPLSLNVFSHAALSLSPPSAFAPSMISFDPSEKPKLHFPLKRGLVNTLLRAGVFFEISLRGVLQQDEQGAGSRRRNWIAGAREIVRATGGRNVIVSTGAVKAGEMRAGEDLVNLCALVGLSASQAKDALTINPQRAILRGLSLRQTYRGVLSNPTLTTFTSEVEGTAAPVEGDARAVAGAKRVADAVDQAPDAETAAASRADKKRKA